VFNVLPGTPTLQWLTMHVWGELGTLFRGPQSHPQGLHCACPILTQAMGAYGWGVVLGTTWSSLSLGR
jgi:hypothetical protein